MGSAAVSPCCVLYGVQNNASRKISLDTHDTYTRWWKQGKPPKRVINESITLAAYQQSLHLRDFTTSSSCQPYDVLGLHHIHHQPRRTLSA